MQREGFTKNSRLLLLGLWVGMILVITALATSCDKVGFTPQGEVELFYKEYSADSVDVLFVLDDSCSMSSIRDAVRSGVLSLSSVEFPLNTRMGVTYTSPAQVLDGITQFGLPYTLASTQVPGFLNLVNRQGVDRYLDLDVSAYDPDEKGKANFPIEACESGWFDSSDTNSHGESCLAGAMQAPFYCTGVEEGVWSLYQLVEKYNRQRLALFRPGSLALVLFVSDTHAPGVSNFYGQAKAPAAALAVNELLEKMRANSPGVASIKFSGIVPVPKEGDRLLDGLKVVGGAPKTDDEATINSEGPRGYTYLPFIRETGGVAVHAKRTDWSAAMRELVRDAGLISNFSLRLSRPALRVMSVWVDNQALDASDFRLDDDGLTVTILRDLSPRQLHEIKVEFVPR